MAPIVRAFRILIPLAGSESQKLPTEEQPAAPGAATRSRSGCDPDRLVSSRAPCAIGILGLLRDSTTLCFESRLIYTLVYSARWLSLLDFTSTASESRAIPHQPRRLRCGRVSTSTHMHGFNNLCVSISDDEWPRSRSLSQMAHM